MKLTLHQILVAAAVWAAIIGLAATARYAFTDHTVCAQ